MKITVNLDFEDTPEDLQKFYQLQTFIKGNNISFNPPILEALTEDLSLEEQEECDRRCQETYNNGTSKTIDFLLGQNSQSISNCIRAYYSKFPNKTKWDCVYYLIANEAWLLDKYKNDNTAQKPINKQIARLINAGELVDTSSNAAVKTYSLVSNETR